MPVFVETVVNNSLNTSAGVPLEGRGLLMTGDEGTTGQIGNGRHKTRRVRGKKTHSRKRSGKTPRKPRGRKHRRTHRRRYAVQSGRGYGFAPLEGDNIGSQGAARADIVPVSTCENVATNP